MQPYQDIGRSNKKNSREKSEKKSYDKKVTMVSRLK